MRRLFEAAAIERDQALIAVHVAALIDGHGEMAAAEQFAAGGLAGRDRGRDALAVEARTGPHPPAGHVVDHQHAHRPVALRLQDEAAVEFQRGAEQDGERDGLAEQLGDRRRIVVPREDIVDRGAEPHHAAAQIERRHLERQDGVVGRMRRRRAGRDFDVHGITMILDRTDPKS